MVKADTLTIAIGSIPGGGPDTSTKLLAKHLPKYLANTNVVVSNMPGAGGLTVANWLYNVADPNKTIGSFTVLNNTLLNAITGNPKVQFDPMHFHWLFSTADGRDNAIVLWANKKRDLRNINMLLVDNDYIIGSQASGDVSIQEVLLKDVLGVKSKFVKGYKNILQAIQTNEIDAYVGTLQSAKMSHPEYLEPGNEIGPILQMGRAVRHPDLIDVPLLDEFVNKTEDVNLLSFFDKQVRLARIYVAPPNASLDVVQRYIEAGRLVEEDPEYQADMKKMGLETKWIKANELTSLVQELVNTPKPVIDRIKELSK